MSVTRYIERLIVRRAVENAVQAGYKLSVFDGEEITVKQSNNVEKVMKALFSVDDEHILYHKEGKRAGWIYLVYGNEGHDVISDYTTNLEDVLAGAMALSEEIENCQ